MLKGIQRLLAISMSLKAQGLPNIFPLLQRRAKERLGSKAGLYLEHFDRKTMVSRTSLNHRSVLALLEGPPKIKDGVALFTFKPDPNIALYDTNLNEQTFKDDILVLSKDAEIIIIDFWNVCYFYETVFGALIMLKKALEKDNKYLALIRLRHQNVLEKMKISKLDKMFIIEESLGEAINAVESRKIQR